MPWFLVSHTVYSFQGQSISVSCLRRLRVFSQAGMRSRALRLEAEKGRRRMYVRTYYVNRGSIEAPNSVCVCANNQRFDDSHPYIGEKKRFYPSRSEIRMGEWTRCFAGPLGALLIVSWWIEWKREYFRYILAHSCFLASVSGASV